MMDAEKLQMELQNQQKEVARPGFGIRHVQVIVLSLTTTILYMLRSSMGVAILNMTDQSQSNKTDVEIYTWGEEIRGVILSSFFWGYVVLQMPAGILAKKFGPKPLVMAALLLNGTLCLLTPIMAKLGDWIAVCAVRVAMGLTQAALFPSIQTFLGKWAPPQERGVISIIANIGVPFGTVLTMPICGVLANTYVGWRLIFYINGALALFGAGVFWAFTANTPREHRLIKTSEVDYIESSLNSGETTSQGYPIPWKRIFTSLPLFAIAMAHLGHVWCFTLFLVQLPTYLKNGLGIDMANSAILSALPFFFQGLVQCTVSILSDYICNRQVLSTTNSRKLFNSIGSIGTGACLVALSFLNSDHKILGVVLACCTLGFLGATFGGFNINFLDLSPNFAGILYSITNCTSTLIGLLAPITTGFILGDHATDPARWRIVFCTGAAIVIATDIIYRIFATSEQQDWNEPEKNTSYHLGNLKKQSLIEDKEIKDYTFVNYDQTNDK